MKDNSLTKISAIFLLIFFLLRVFFFIEKWQEIDFNLLEFLIVFLIGIAFDIITLLYIMIIPICYYTFINRNFFNSKIHLYLNKFFYLLLLYFLIFTSFSEIVFWEEFQTRFNFIAVDYLIYTTEVIANIIESYPIYKILTLIVFITFVIFLLTYKKIIKKKEEKFSLLLKKFLISLSLILFCFFAIDSEKLSNIFSNKYLLEISKNGIYEFFSAYRNNQINYQQMYETRDPKISLENLRNSILKQEPNSKFIDQNSIAREIKSAQHPEKKYNIMLVAVESFSADFMSFFDNKKNITPNLDYLAENGLFFTNLYAVGTRTIRGLEALSLSVPPTPGSSIIRRQNNENLFNISSPLNDRGYESKFIYGGFGYFDNMNYFFSKNGFQVIDRRNFTNEEVSFANAWGVADEDLFNKTIKEADISYQKKKSFFNFVMTTSNHRPFTYPDNKIDIPSKTGRSGAIKYTDYAIGKFIEMAKKKAWFDNTIFIFVADHCAGSAGVVKVPMRHYHIPAIFYAPKILKPKKIEQITSQIDIAPTLFGIMNLSYKSKFFGIDVLNNKKNLDRHVFVSTYTDIGYFEDNKLYLLRPKKQHQFFDVKIMINNSKETETENYEEEELDEVIAYYQTASEMFKNGSMKNFKIKK
jgi:phosphoglycerol transferase MdoB-like AlkP superfamily enzyme